MWRGSATLEVIRSSWTNINGLLCKFTLRDEPGGLDKKTIVVVNFRTRPLSAWNSYWFFDWELFWGF